jgi:hypothetical protein
MFPKSVSGTSGKLRENKGDDMAEDGVNDAMIREKLKDVVRHAKTGNALSFRTDSAYAQAIIWASERIGQLELENENLSKTILTLSKSPQLASPDPDEETHQQRRRERMLDEITLICVRDGIERLKGDQTEEKGCGFLARDIADKLCYGIDKWDAT